MSNKVNWDTLQHVEIHNFCCDKNITCNCCGANFSDISNVKYKGKSKIELLYKEELYECKKCQTLFVIHYNLFDEEGHIYPLTFSEDINDPNYVWHDNLREDQKELISKHLEICEICQNRLTEEMVTDALFSDFLNSLRKK